MIWTAMNAHIIKRHICYKTSSGRNSIEWARDAKRAGTTFNNANKITAVLVLLLNEIYWLITIFN